MGYGDLDCTTLCIYLQSHFMTVLIISVCDSKWSVFPDLVLYILYESNYPTPLMQIQPHHLVLQSIHDSIILV